MSEATKPVAAMRTPALSTPVGSGDRNTHRLRGWAIAVVTSLVIWGALATGIWMILAVVR